jgi:hypothetical protein
MTNWTRRRLTQAALRQAAGELSADAASSADIAERVPGFAERSGLAPEQIADSVSDLRDRSADLMAGVARLTRRPL